MEIGTRVLVAHPVMAFGVVLRSSGGVEDGSMDGSCVPRVTFRVTHRPSETLPEERALCGASGGTVADQRPTFRPPHFLDRFLDVTSALLI